MKPLERIDSFGNLMVGIFHRIALFLIGGATVWAAGGTFFEVYKHSFHASIQDLLLLFIYLELGAMVGIYFKSNHMPVRFLIYIAITALTRHTIDLVATGIENFTAILVLGATTLLMAVSVLVLRYASFKFPSDRDNEGKPHSDSEIS